MSSDLFTDDQARAASQFQPLAARLRPQNLDQYLGQDHLLGAGKPLRKCIELGQVHSMILWGPPGTGKTSLAKLLANEVNANFVSISAVLAGVKEIRAAITDAEHQLQMRGRKTLLFIDEVHRFNKSQQDAFLPYVEDGTITFIGATTENPSFEVNNALLSRCRVYVLQRFSPAQMQQLVDRALTSEQGLLERQLQIGDTEIQMLISAADGDARRVLNILEIASDLVDDDGLITRDLLEQVLLGDVRRFDKGGDLFYEQISALHKSVRGSDPDASLYWFSRMLDGGCDPLYIARRVVRMATEDIGNADPRGLEVALNAWDVQQRLGSPEGELALAQAVLYLASAPKSNAVYNAYKAAKADVRSQPSYDVPNHLRNAPTTLMKNMEFGRGYRYAHDEPDAFAAGEVYFPDQLEPRQYYQPVERGLEIKIAEKLRHLRRLNEQAPNPASDPSD
jgi:Recombination protein MgsA